MEYINFDRVIGISGFILAIVGIILTVKANKKVILFYGLSNLSVLKKNTKSLEKFKITYNNIIVDQAAVSNLVFWNGGNETLNFKENSPKSPFMVTLGAKTRILDAFLVYESDVYNSTNLLYIPETNYINISFDYFEPKEGFIIKIIHTEANFSNIILKGAFKGSKPVTKGFINGESGYSGFIFVSIGILFLFGLLTYGAVQGKTMWLRIPFGLGAVFLFFLWVLALKIYINYTSNKIPHELQKIFDEN